jgi:Predicted membrane protein
LCVCLFNYCFISLSLSLPSVFCHSFFFRLILPSFVILTLSSIHVPHTFCQTVTYFPPRCPLFRLLNVVYFLCLAFLLLFCVSVLFLTFYALRFYHYFRSLFPISFAFLSFSPYDFLFPVLFSFCFEFLFYVCLTFYFSSLISFLLFPVVVYSPLLCCFCNICPLPLSRPFLFHFFFLILLLVHFIHMYS